MLAAFSPEVEKARKLTGDYGTNPGERMGAFFLRCPATNERLKVIISDGSDWQEQGLPGPQWEHVSVSCQFRPPTWSEMDWVKDQFFSPEETCIQLHVAKKYHIEIHPNVLHLWRLLGQEFPLPPKQCV